MTTGDGGMLVTNNKDYYEKIKKLRWVGMDKDTFDRKADNNYARYYNIDCLWYKYHMNDIAAAIWIEIPVMKWYAGHANHNYVIKTQQRNELNEYLAKNDISTWVHYIPNNHYDMYKKFWHKTPITEEVWTKLLTLPLYPSLTDEQVSFVIDKIKNFKI